MVLNAVENHSIYTWMTFIGTKMIEKIILTTTILITLIAAAAIPSVYAQSASVQGTVQIQAVCGIGVVSGSPINYGTLIDVNQISSDQTLRIENTGRGQETVLVRGTPWTDGGIPFHLTRNLLDGVRGNR
jgi:hypothetical protein